METYPNRIQQQPATGSSCDEANDEFLVARPDLLRRFSLTPHIAHLRLMGRSIRIESNDISLLHLGNQFFQSHQHGISASPEFVWRVICEPDLKVQSTGVPLSAFSDVDLRYVNIGQRGFLAVDFQNHAGVGFLPKVFLEGQPRLRHRPPLDILFCMTACALGLVSLSGGCVGADGRGVMVFGAPNSGKTTSCYFAAESGLEFHADQVLFLDARQNCAWGDPFPAVFRPETLQFIPELRGQVHQSSYAESSFYYFDKSHLQPCEARPIIPVCSIFLDRGAGCEVRWSEISRAETISRLRQSVLFEEGDWFEDQTLSALKGLAEKPAYELRYDSDPKIAASFIERMLR